MHLTLKFFTAIPEESLEKIGQIMLSVEALYSSFPISILGLGTFQITAHAWVLWLGIQGGLILNQLHEVIFYHSRLNPAGGAPYSAAHPIFG